MLAALISKKSQFKYNKTVLPGGWWRTSGAGPAPPPAPAMTSPGRASTCISLKPRSAAKQSLEPLMCRRTPDRWRKSPRLERRPVAVQLTQTKRVTAVGDVTVTGGGPATGPAMDAIATAKRWRQRAQVQTTWMDRDVPSCIACQVVGEQARSCIVAYL